MIHVFSVQVWHSSRIDLRVSANTPDKLHNVHLHRETRSPGARRRLNLPQRLLKVGECMLINVDCVPWSHRRSLETHLHPPWRGVFVFSRVTRAGEEILTYSQKALTWVCPACQLRGHAAFFGHLIWSWIPNHLSQFPVHPEDIYPSAPFSLKHKRKWDGACWEGGTLCLPHLPSLPTLGKGRWWPCSPCSASMWALWFCGGRKQRAPTLWRSSALPRIFPSISQSLNSLVCICFLEVKHGKYNTTPDPGISS